MKKKNKRLITLCISFTLFSLGCLILFINLRDNLIFFYSPSEIFEKEISLEKTVRVGGMVKEKSLNKKIKEVNGMNVEEISFVITDYEKEIIISYVGILPDLFREGQGVVVEGFIVNKGLFNAKTVLAKHDENYMPPEIKDLEILKGKTNDI